MSWRRIARDSLVLLGAIACAAYWFVLTFGDGGQAVDAHAYWAADPSNLYTVVLRGETTDAYNYPPAFELVVGWGRLLPFEVFAAIWRALLLAVLLWLGGPFTLFVLFTVPVASEVNAGNIQILLAAAVVLGFRWPQAWAFVAFTKPTAAVGALWFILRREWSALGTIVIAGLVVLGLSVALWASQWPDYVRFLLTAPGTSVAPYYAPLALRLPVAVALIALAAWRGWRWPVVVGSTLALPAYYIISSSMLVGVLPFAREALGRWLDERSAREPATPRSAGASAAG